MAVDTTLDGTEVYLPIDGQLCSAPVGTPLPTSATAALNAAFIRHGYWTAEGATEAESRSTTPVRAFQNNAQVANPVTDATATIAVSLLQVNAENVELYYGNDVSASGGVKWQPGVANGDRVFVLDKVDGNGDIERTVVGRGEVTTRGDRVTVQGGARALPITISIYDDSAEVFYSALATA